jgi:rfaE bifunctional protein nucleotidyltransferase chain/domain
MSMDERRLWTDAGELSRALERGPGRGRPLVLANGVFDILHVGHVRYLEEAAALGAVLVVALNDDASTRSLKGAGRPVMPAADRAALLLALRCVDHVLVFGGATVDGVIRELRPDVHAKGTDYTADTVPERETARAVGCRTVIAGDPKDHSSSAVLRGIRGADARGS